MWWGNGEPAGQIVDGEIRMGAEHQVWTPPPTQEQRVAEQFTSLEQENKRLMAELEAIKAEKKNQKSQLHPKASLTLGAQPLCIKTGALI